jgi:gamma-glutamylcyclotransferase (GGCT)/AIG2-like uncharacterized protein YtfP
MRTSRIIGAGYTLDDDFMMYRTRKDKFNFPIAMRTDFTSINGHIHGEVYLCPTTRLIELDFIESNGTMYYREEIPIVLTTADTGKRALVNAWAYFGLPSYWSSKIGNGIILCDQLRRSKDPDFAYYTFQRRWDGNNQSK